jgi:hypothetical protein
VDGSNSLHYGSLAGKFYFATMEDMRDSENGERLGALGAIRSLLDSVLRTFLLLCYL